MQDEYEKAAPLCMCGLASGGQHPGSIFITCACLHCGLVQASSHLYSVVFMCETRAVAPEVE